MSLTEEAQEEQASGAFFQNSLTDAFQDSLGLLCWLQRVEFGNQPLSFLAKLNKYRWSWIYDYREVLTVIGLTQRELRFFPVTANELRNR